MQLRYLPDVVEVFLKFMSFSFLNVEEGLLGPLFPVHLPLLLLPHFHPLYLSLKQMRIYRQESFYPYRENFAFIFPLELGCRYIFVLNLPPLAWSWFLGRAFLLGATPMSMWGGTTKPKDWPTLFKSGKAREMLLHYFCYFYLFLL